MMIRVWAILILLAFYTGMLCAEDRPNILFMIADDASIHYGDCYHCDWVHTPHIDKLGKAGLIFDGMYTPTSKCAPSRAALITGRNPWQLEEAANHQPYFPMKFKAFTEVLAEQGVHCGGTGKTWGPGEAKTADGKPRNFGLKSYPTPKDSLPGAAFAKFLKDKPADAPFFYWFGSHNPHRPYKRDDGINKGKKIDEIDHVPAYWPDNELVRRDMLDYATEIEAFDEEIGSIVTELDKSGLRENTLIIVTSDHGMPFPRVKGHTFDDAHHIPFVACWNKGIKNPGRRVSELLSFIDLAPTVLSLMKIDGTAQGMSAITGQSFADIFADKKGSRREYVIVGRERNDVLCRPGTPAGLGYPARAIRTQNFFYVFNFKDDRWPCGDPTVGLKDTDASPTKELIEGLGTESPFWQAAFGKRPADQLFDVTADGDCVSNLAADPKYQQKVQELKTKLLTELKSQGDPRALGQGDIFDQYLSPRTLPPKNKKQQDAKPEN